MSTFSLLEIDDGHKPGKTTVPTKLAVNEKATTKFVSVFDDLLPELWCQRGYELAAERKRPWGVYITAEDAENASLNPEVLFESDPQRAIALTAARELIYKKGKGLLGDLLADIHGTVVWCLVSAARTNVEYHIDYAELYRYETNVIHPPLIGGVCHLSPFRSGDMEGGDFLLNVEGLDHYKRYGYKGRLRGEAALLDDISHNSDWMTIPYRHNRGLLFDGDFPHSSSGVRTLKEGMYRVILGFNCFSAAVGECCIRAPEHSDAFNRTIKMYQTMSAAGMMIAGSASASASSSESCSNASTCAEASIPLPSAPLKSRLTIEDVKKSPFLKKIILAAAAAKLKESVSKIDSVDKV